MDSPMEVITKSARETQKLGEKVADTLKNGGVVTCYGELGSGKTTLIQGLAKGLGIKRRILSPTFVMIRQYAIHRKPNATFYHIDLYRIEKSEEAMGLGILEIFADKNAIVAIEWAEKIKNILPKKRIDIFFKYKGENERKIKMNFLQ